ncbi:MAG: DUF2255 family protein [Acidobacteria bacterium]|nr:DUF2255 family protein [Acidobacteriota bacterium]
MAKNQKLPDAQVEALHRAKIIGVRAGNNHRYTGVWVVVADGRVFVRSWNDKPTGWFRAFRAEPDGTIQVEGREIPVRTRLVRSARILGAVTAAFGQKYHTPGSRRWVEGFAEPAREKSTLELLPR